jgi:hypothetical protein
MPVIASSIVYEKETSLREVMKMMGLKHHIYWTVTYVFNYLLYVITTTLIVALAIAFDFRLFKVNNIGVVAVFFLLWGHTLLAFSMFLSVFFTKTRTVTVVGYIYVFATGIISVQLVNTFLTDPSTPSYLVFLVSCIPQFTMYRGLIELSQAVKFGGQGIKFSNFQDANVNMGTVYAFLIVEWIILMLLSFYLEAVLPSPIGVKSHPLFPFHYIRDLINGKKTGEVGREIDYEAMGKIYPEGEGEDVKAERERTYADKESLLRIYNLKKVYPSQNGMPPHTAVHNLTFSVGEGECFGFLGTGLYIYIYIYIYGR